MFEWKLFPLGATKAQFVEMLPYVHLCIVRRGTTVTMTCILSCHLIITVTRFEGQVQLCFITVHVA